MITVLLDANNLDVWVPASHHTHGFGGWMLGEKAREWLRNQGMKQCPWEPKPGQYMIFGSAGTGKGPGLDFHDYDARRVMMFKLMFGGK